MRCLRSVALASTSQSRTRSPPPTCLRDRCGRGRLTTDHLRRVQQRRQLPVRVTQRFQVLIQRRVIATVLSAAGPLELPLPLRLLARFPVLRRLPGRLIGVGIRPEHVKTLAIPVDARV